MKRLEKLTLDNQAFDGSAQRTLLLSGKREKSKSFHSAISLFKFNENEVCFMSHYPIIANDMI